VGSDPLAQAGEGFSAAGEKSLSSARNLVAELLAAHTPSCCALASTLDAGQQHRIRRSGSDYLMCRRPRPASPAAGKPGHIGGDPRARTMPVSSIGHGHIVVALGPALPPGAPFFLKTYDQPRSAAAGGALNLFKSIYLFRGAFGITTPCDKSPCEGGMVGIHAT
jgi:hypothetical protein